MLSSVRFCSRVIGLYPSSLYYIYTTLTVTTMHSNAARPNTLFEWTGCHRHASLATPCSLPGTQGQRSKEGKDEGFGENPMSMA